jgi:glycine/D-amino acid oxidase-like deaminating enzyme
MLSIEQSCYWMASSAFEYEPELDGAQRTDVAIIGGGLTGLWSAVFLREMSPELEITILEQGMVGYGGSGRNAGILDVSIDHSHALAISHFGVDEAKKLARIGIENVEEMLAFLSSNRIDCDIERTGRLFVALTTSQFEDAARSIDTARSFGLSHWKLLNAEEIQDEVHSPLYVGGLFDPDGVILNPFKLVQGLKQYLKSRNVKIFENSSVKKLDDRIIQTDHATLTARKVILATDAFSHHLFPKLISRYIPLYDYILVSEPLSPAQMNAIGWRNRQGITDGRTFFNYYRLTADNRILFGTSEAMYYSPNRVGPELDHSTFHYEALHDSFIRHFPQLAELQFPFLWGGPIASTTRLTPFFGTMENGSVHYALGYTGHGLGSTRIAGRILAHKTLDRSTNLFELKLVRQKPLPFPPEPIRSLAVKTVTKSLRNTDAGKSEDFILKILNWMKIGFSS